MWGLFCGTRLYPIPTHNPLPGCYVPYRDRLPGASKRSFGRLPGDQPCSKWAMNSDHSRRFRPLVSCVTASPASMRFSTETICADSVTAPSR
jgi:hypothetical protein